MADLHVTVRFNDYIVEDRVLPVKDVVRIGESADARVHFPGASVAVCRVGESLDIRGRRLAEGQKTGFSLGLVHVDLEHLAPLEVARMGPLAIDARFLLVALAVTTGGMWVDTLSTIAEDPPEGRVAAWVDAAEAVVPFDHRGDDAFRAGVQPNGELAHLPKVVIRGEGREATNDDRQTGYQYYRWYRLEVPSTLRAELARLRIEEGRTEDYALIARGAYDNDNWREALVHYQALADAEPDDVRWLYGVAQCQKRLGLHRMELESYERILERQPDHRDSIGNGAVALARLGDYEASAEWLLRMHRAPGQDAPYLNVYSGLIASIEGRESDAIRQLELAVSGRSAMTDGERVELRRDLAMDPALHSLRKDRALRSMLWRHYGAAAPRKSR